ncbi:unnamed protein product [Ectocarpus sp. 12 AP-2014]
MGLTHPALSTITIFLGFFSLAAGQPLTLTCTSDQWVAVPYGTSTTVTANPPLAIARGGDGAYTYTGTPGNVISLTGTPTQHLQWPIDVTDGLGATASCSVWLSIYILGTCGVWNVDNICQAPTPVYRGDDLFCGGVCSASTCCEALPPTPAPTPTPHHEPTPTPASTPTPLTWGGGGVEGDPHMQGLRGQRINWSGVDGGWYSLIKDDGTDTEINVRVTAPLSDEFPDRQLVTSLAVMSKGHSLEIEVQNPYTTDTDGCPEGVSPCLANGGLRILVDGQEADGLFQFSRQVSVGDGAISVSATNLPVECRKFGGQKIWGRMYQEMLEGRRRLDNSESFEDWILKSDHMPAPRWCAKYIAENDLADLQSTHAIFKIETPTLTVRLDAGVNYQGDGELDWDGRVLPDLDFWQMDVLVDGLDVENPALSGLLGETARPMYDENGNEVMAGFEAFRGTVEDYRVSSALGVQFPLLDEKEREEGHE